METERLRIRRMEQADESAFTGGIADRALRTAYGFPAEADADVLRKIFSRFSTLPGAYALVEKETGKMAGFMLDVDPELPEETAAGLPGRGRTLAYAVFRPFRRRGYMLETLDAYIGRLFQEGNTGYVHCGHFPENEPSRNLLRKLGFREYSRHTAASGTIVDEILIRWKGEKEP